MTTWKLGTIGFGYKDWQGGFYPPGMTARDYLSYYSKVFNSVELDTTFYGSPQPSTVRNWVSAVQPGFSFSPKTPRVITHDLALIGADDLMHEFLRAIQALKDNLGPILIQFPPRFTSENQLILQEFLDKLSPEYRYAIEFRHPSWHNEGTAGLLRNYHISWVATDFPGLPEKITPTTDFLYIRWIGQHGSYSRHTHEQVDLSSRLETWIKQVNNLQNKPSLVYGFFNNDYAGFAAGSCLKFMSLLGLTVHQPTYPKQGRLFK
jgi:uncharacterized protein YecE (DUF72 family)